VYEQRRATSTAAARTEGGSAGRLAATHGRDETEAERADRNYGELLQELRVAQTGVQFLFAFLLTLPFTPVFQRIDTTQRYIYLVTMLATAVAAACLLAPVNQHRLLFRLGLKKELVDAGDVLARAGMAFLMVALIGATGLTVDFVVGRTAAAVIGGLETLLFLLLWYGQPLRLRARHRGAGSPDSGD
jgi:hypothetical protein